ncbi:GNAT family N-acetyltransferase [Rhodopseudomonas palustris]|uniref:GNAT family N-acetyltransferase n=1 Tax=Rhodopseudomonas palustris TaxID=1076 RepID=UPI002ACE0409|nr:GNAT family N-acetyltransferase [Rhodopseudomonas palustris]WQG99875.1 GNAT family N-acetyltransferase [Rhodopseudomonas palustris]
MAFDVDDPGRFTDTVRLSSGASLTLRFAGVADTDLLQHYFRTLSDASRYSRLMGAAPELPHSQLARFVHIGEADAFTVLASIASDSGETVVGEIRYALHRAEAAVEFGISVDDRWHGRGVGIALLSNLECRAAALGADRIFGDTLRSNAAMIRLARKCGYEFQPSPYDWKQTRLGKAVDYAPQDIPCASWRLAAATRGVAPAR